jgi:hypothetical protein
MVLDRRLHSRQTVQPDVYVDLFPSNAGWLSNISAGGLAIHLFSSAVSGQAVRLGFDLPGSSSRIEANCQIAWIDESGRKAGLQFLDLPETSRQRITKWLSVPAPSLAGRLAGLLVGAVALCGLTFAFVYMLDLAESSPRSTAVPSADKQAVSTSEIPGPFAKPSTASGTDSTSNASLIPKGAVALQVAALTEEGHALAMAEALQKKNFPVFVLRPSTDRYYRVWVGPYADAESARLAKDRLEKEGFKAILKR